MTLRFEIFPDDLDVIADFYQRVLGFSLVTDQRHTPAPYLSLQRGTVRVGAARREVPDALAAGRDGARFLGGEDHRAPGVPPDPTSDAVAASRAPTRRRARG